MHETHGLLGRGGGGGDSECGDDCSSPTWGGEGGTSNWCGFPGWGGGFHMGLPTRSGYIFICSNNRFEAAGTKSVSEAASKGRAIAT